MFKLSESEVLSNGDSIDVSLKGPLKIFVGGYSEEKQISSQNLEISLDGENWSSSVTVDFSSIIDLQLWVRNGSSQTGTIEVNNV